LVALMLRDADFRRFRCRRTARMPLLFANQFDALLLDNWMPGTSGLDIYKQIRAIDKDTPIIFCSVAVTPADIAATKTAGARDYLEKPFDPDHLLAVMRSRIKRS